MVIGILGTKVGMTQFFEKNGNLIPTTIIKCGPCYVTEIKNLKNSGYNAIQIGYLKSPKKYSASKFNKDSLAQYHLLKEYKTNNISEYFIGQKLNLEDLTPSTSSSATK